jgi:hypothetical protein
VEEGGVSSQSVLGLDLAKASLPDAIAAMVEAWYDAQGVEPEALPEPSADLAECIDYILNQTVQAEAIKGLTIKPDLKIRHLLLIRHSQSFSSKSNASASLFRHGIEYRGSTSEWIEIENDPLVLRGLDQATDERYSLALLDAPGAEFIESTYRSRLKIPSKYFMDRVVRRVLP